MESLGTFERVWVQADAPPFDAIYRVAVGFAFLPAVSALTGQPLGPGPLVAAFVVLLAGLRVVPAVLRKLLPFSPAALSAWTHRRQIAKRYDSYQWQKLLWIGLGLLAYIAAARVFAAAVIALTVACIVAGALGLITWRARRPRTASLG